MDQGPVSSPDSHAFRRDERRLVTVLFADLAGFTGLAEHRDPEEVQELLNSCFDVLVPCVERYEGTIDKFIGDAMMILFGAPIAHENDAERAIRTALDIRVALAEFNRERGLALAVHQGISTGLVLAGSVGGGQRHDYSVIGDTVNIASRLEDLSAPGEILISPDTYALAGSSFDIEEAETVTVRGRVEPIQVRRVLGVAKTSTIRVLGRLHAPMVGRERELEVFLDALRAVQDGQGGVLYISGWAGLGKSRLISEARKSIDADAVTWLEGQAISTGHNVSYHPFRQMIETDIQASTDDVPSERLTKLERRVAYLMPNARSHELDFLAALAEAETSEHRDWLDSFDEPVFQQRLHGAIAAYMRGLARERPLVLVFEDLHRVDDSSYSAIEALLPLVEATPVLICLVSRPNLESSVFQPERVTDIAKKHFGEMRLKPLEREESRQLVARLLGSAQLPLRLYQLIENRAQGNPFFVQEIILSLVGSEALTTNAEGDWQLGDHLDHAVPDTLQGIIASRVDRLPLQARQTIRTASVIGHSFTSSVMSGVTGLPREETTAQLGQLEDLEIIRVLTANPEPEFILAHALIQEAVYETMPLRERRILHEKVADALKSLMGVTDERAAEVAYHYGKAQKWAQAQEYLFKAGRQARSLGAAEASQYYREALEAILSGWSGQCENEAPSTSLDWFESGVVPLVHQQQLPLIFEPLRDFHAKMTATFGPEDRRSLIAAEMLGYAYSQKWMMPESISIFEHTLKYREVLDGSRDPSLALMMAWLAAAYVNTGRNLEAEKLLIHGIDLQQNGEAMHVDTLATLYTVLSYCKAAQGQLSEQKALLEDALALPGLNTSPVYCGLLANLCNAEVELGLNAQAETHGRIGSENGVIFVRTICRMNLGFALRTSGQYRKALEELERASDVFENLENDENFAWALAEIAECRLQLGELDAAAEAAQRATDVMKTKGGGSHTGTLGQALWTLAGVESARGNLAEAERLLEEAGTLVSSDHSYGAKFWQADMLYRQAQIDLKKGSRDRAGDEVARAARLLEELGGKKHARRKMILAEWDQLTSQA